MSDADSLRVRIATFLQQRRQLGDDGKALLLGLDGVRPVFALAAGLQGEQDHPGFVTFARYLLHRRFACDGHALLLPAAVDGEPVYMLELHHGGVLDLHLFDALGETRAWPSGGPLIADLTVAEAGLPGVQRRELDRLYGALELPVPV